MYKYTSELRADELGTNVMTVGVENYGLRAVGKNPFKKIMLSLSLYCHVFSVGM
jgi:hypothetical protein